MAIGHVLCQSHLKQANEAMGGGERGCAEPPRGGARGAAEEPEGARCKEAGGRSFLGSGRSRRRFQEGGSVLVKDKSPYDEGWILLTSGKKEHLRGQRGRAVGWEQKRQVSAQRGSSVGGCGLTGLRLQE